MTLLNEGLFFTTDTAFYRDKCLWMWPYLPNCNHSGQLVALVLVFNSHYVKGRLLLQTIKQVNFTLIKDSFTAKLYQTFWDSFHCHFPSSAVLKSCTRCRPPLFTDLILTTQGGSWGSIPGDGTLKVRLNRTLGNLTCWLQTGLD